MLLEGEIGRVLLFEVYCATVCVSGCERERESVCVCVCTEGRKQQSLIQFFAHNEEIGDRHC